MPGRLCTGTPRFPSRTSCSNASRSTRACGSSRMSSSGRSECQRCGARLSHHDMIVCSLLLPPGLRCTHDMADDHGVSRRLSPTLVLEMRVAAAGGASVGTLARRHGVALSTAAKVLTGATHAGEGGPLAAPRPRLSRSASWDVVRLAMRQRLTEEVTVDQGGCWRLMGAGDRARAVLQVAGRYWRVARLSFEVFVGPVPAGWMVGSDCGHSCLRPEHLRLVRAGRAAAPVVQRQFSDITACPAGHCYADHDVVRYHLTRAGSVTRSCRPCERARQQRGLRVAPAGSRAPPQPQRGCRSAFL